MKWPMTVLVCVALFLSGAAAGALLFGNGSSRRGDDRRPEEAEQPLLDMKLVIDFDKRYDLTCEPLGKEGKEPRVIPRCKIRGFTGTKDRPKGSYSYGYSSGEPRGLFDGWLVLELEDGRLAYVPPGSVRLIEESAPRRN